MKKYGHFVLIVLTVLIIFAGCAKQQSNTGTDPAKEELVLTLEELAKYNGKDGQPAYIAVDGIIYDVSSVPQWPNGQHNGFEAGNDLSEEIKTISPHGVSKLNGLPVVGKLAQ